MCVGGGGHDTTIDLARTHRVVSAYRPQRGHSDTQTQRPCKPRLSIKIFFLCKPKAGYRIEELVAELADAINDVGTAPSANSTRRHMQLADSTSLPPLRGGVVSAYLDNSTGADVFYEIASVIDYSCSRGLVAGTDVADSVLCEYCPQGKEKSSDSCGDSKPVCCVSCPQGKASQGGGELRDGELRARRCESCKPGKSPNAVSAATTCKECEKTKWSDTGVACRNCPDQGPSRPPSFRVLACMRTLDATGQSRVITPPR